MKSPPWLVAVVGGVLLGLCMQHHAGTMETDIRTRSAAALTALGVPVTGLSVSGRDLLLTGYAGTPQVSERAVHLLQELYGVRVVDTHILGKLAEGPEVKQLQATFEKVALKNVEFNTGSADLTPAGRAILDEVVVALGPISQLAIQIEGHTDNAGPAPANLLLSQKRAETVKAYLASRGVKNPLTTRGFGETRPIADNQTPAGRAANRRIEFHIEEK